MPLHRDHPLLRMFAFRWPSRNHRDYQSPGALAAWRSRRSRAPVQAPTVEQPGCTPGAPLVSRIVGTRRAGGVLYVEIVACRETLDGRATTLAREHAGRPSADAQADCGDLHGDHGTSWTVPLLMN